MGKLLNKEYYSSIESDDYVSSPMGKLLNAEYIVHAAAMKGFVPYGEIVKRRGAVNLH